MKRIFCLLPLLALGCAGSKGATCGWRFEVGKPGELYTNIPYQQGSGQLGIAPVGAIGLDSRVAVMGATRMAVGEDVEQLPAASLLRPRSAARSLDSRPDCTQQEICDLLRLIADRVGAKPRSMDSKPMPKE